MNLVDTGGWLEYFANSDNADFFAPAIENTNRLLVPSLCIFEVYKRVCQQKTEDEALQAVAVMQQGKIVELDISLSLYAARLSLTHRLPLADSIILATAYANNAIIWTQDDDFQNLERVKFHPKVKKKTVIA